MLGNGKNVMKKDAGIRSSKCLVAVENFCDITENCFISNSAGGELRNFIWMRSVTSFDFKGANV